MSPILENDYERMVPEFHRQTLTYAEHMTRYICAQELVKGKSVLDIASGSGYGTKMLAETAKMVFGVDINDKAVQYSKKFYGKGNIKYLLGDGESIPLSDDSVDVVTTFETIEHIKNYKTFIKEVKRVLKPGGIALVSTPNDLEFAEGNHFHLHEFEKNELLSLLRKDFKYIKQYYQATWKYVAIGEENMFSSEGEFTINTKNFSPIKPENFLYFYFICSDKRINEAIEPLAATGELYSDRKVLEVQSKFEERIRALESENAALSTKLSDIKKLNLPKIKRDLKKIINSMKQQKG